VSQTAQPLCQYNFLVPQVLYSVFRALQVTATRGQRVLELVDAL
jgi:hypothetical protein